MEAKDKNLISCFPLTRFRSRDCDVFVLVRSQSWSERSFQPRISTRILCAGCIFISIIAKCTVPFSCERLLLRKCKVSVIIAFSSAKWDGFVFYYSLADNARVKNVLTFKKKKYVLEHRKHVEEIREKTELQVDII